MKIYRDNFTIEVGEKGVRGGTVYYASERFSILMNKRRELTPLERDLLRWAFRGEKLPFEPSGDGRLVYSYINGVLLKIEKKPGFLENSYTHVELNGEKFRVYKDYVDGDYVIPGREDIIIVSFQGVPNYLKFSGEGIKLTVYSLNSVPEFVVNFVRSGDVEVLKKYLPFDEKLSADVRVWENKMVLEFAYSRPGYAKMKTANLVMNKEEGVARGVGVFRDGVVKLAVPFEDLARLKDNLSFGLVPEEYVEEWFLKYPPLKGDVEVVALVGPSRIEVRFERGDYWDKKEVGFDGKYSYFKSEEKKKRASKKAIVKYLREAGMLE